MCIRDRTITATTEMDNNSNKDTKGTGHLAHRAISFITEVTDISQHTGILCYSHALKLNDK